VASRQDITATLAAANPADKARVYAERGSTSPTTKTAASSSNPGRG
jgi:hypothetical protein